MVIRRLLGHKISKTNIGSTAGLRRFYTPLGHKLRIFTLRETQFPGIARQGRCVTGGII